MMVEFLLKAEIRGDKIVRVNSILITKSINLLNFCTVLGCVVMLTFFKITATFSTFLVHISYM